MSAPRPTRPIYVIRLRPERGTDAIRSLRHALKFLLRQCQLRCLSVDEERVVDVREEHNDVAREERSKQRRHTAPTEHFGAVLELITRANRR